MTARAHVDAKPIPHGTYVGYAKRKCRCEECTAANREHGRRYRQANAAKVRDYQRQWHAANQDRAAENKRQWYLANKEKAREDQRRWEQANPEKVKASRRANAKKIAEGQRRWREANPERVRASKNAREHRRRARKRGLFVEDVPRVEIFERDSWQCKIPGCLYPGVPVSLDVAYTDPLYASVDHVIPLSKGGPHERSNLQTAHLRCNTTKNARPEGIPSTAA